MNADKADFHENSFKKTYDDNVNYSFLEKSLELNHKNTSFGSNILSRNNNTYESAKNDIKDIFKDGRIKSLENSDSCRNCGKENLVTKTNESLTDINQNLNSPVSTESFNINAMSTWASRNGFKEDLMGFQNVEKQKNIVRKNLKLHATLLFIGVVLTTCLAIIDTQISGKLYQQKKYYENSLHNLTKYNISKNVLKKEREKIELFRIIETSAKTLITIISLASIVILYMYYQNILHVKIIRNFYPSSMGLLRATPLLKKYLIECFICIVHVPPFLNTYMYIPSSAQIIVFLRLYLLGRYLKEKHELMNSQSTRFLASVTKTELTSMFLFKTFFMQYPFQLILLAYFIILFIGGYGVWLIEQHEYTYLDTVWMLIITMTTVGFGDLTPKTMLGRFTVGLAAIIGIFLMALFISLVNEALMLQRREKRILSYVEGQDLTRQKKFSAADAIIKWYKYFRFVNKFMKVNNAQTHYLLEKKPAQSNPDIFTITRAKLMESKMIKAINYWRKVKEAQPSGYFAQEFMVEDMKMMMNDLKEKSENMETDIETIKNNINVMMERQQQENLEKSHGRDSMKKKRCNSNESKTYFKLETPDKGFEYGYIENPWLKDSNQVGFNTTTKNNGEFASRIGHLSKTISKINKNGEKIIGKNELHLAYRLLLNHVKIMNGALDDIYHKTRQDINDLENLIKSLLLCSEKDATIEKHLLNDT